MALGVILCLGIAIGFISTRVAQWSRREVSWSDSCGIAFSKGTQQEYRWLYHPTDRSLPMRYDADSKTVVWLSGDLRKVTLCDLEGVRREFPVGALFRAWAEPSLVGSMLLVRGGDDLDHWKTWVFDIKRLCGWVYPGGLFRDWTPDRNAQMPDEAKLKHVSVGGRPFLAIDQMSTASVSATGHYLALRSKDWKLRIFGDKRRIEFSGPFGISQLIGQFCFSSTGNDLYVTYPTPLDGPTFLFRHRLPSTGAEFLASSQNPVQSPIFVSDRDKAEIALLTKTTVR